MGSGHVPPPPVGPQFKSALKENHNISVYLELCKVYVKLDQPNTAIESYTKGLEVFPADTSLLIGISRIHMMMGAVDKGVAGYKRVRVPCSPLPLPLPPLSHCVPVCCADLGD